MSSGPSSESSRPASRQGRPARSGGDPPGDRANPSRGGRHRGGAGGEGRCQGPGPDEGRGDQGPRRSEAQGVDRTRERRNARDGWTRRFDGGDEGPGEHDATRAGGRGDRRFHPRADGGKTVDGGNRWSEQRQNATPKRSTTGTAEHPKDRGTFRNAAGGECSSAPSGRSKKTTSPTGQRP